jgi:hypothetical protein
LAMEGSNFFPLNDRHCPRRAARRRGPRRLRQQVQPPSERATIAIIVRNAANAAASAISCTNPKARRAMEASIREQVLLICSLYVRVKAGFPQVVSQFDL